jgi:ubiquinone/menaquinone biosynthesis C-methylase UbiE
MNQLSSVLQDEYQKRFEANAEYRNQVWEILCKDFFSQYVKDDAVLLDLGAGWGEFSRNIKAHTKYAMDLNPECGRRVTGHATFLQQDCSTLWPLEDGSLDVVFTSNFLEHLPNKSSIDLTLKEAYRCLKKGGLMICMGPNIRYLPGLYWDYWDHYVPITDASMAEALKLTGFGINQVTPRFLPYTMSGGSNPPLIAIKAFLRMKFAWPWFGKQFLVVAQK